MTKFTLTELKSSFPRPSVLIGWLALLGVLAWSYSLELFELRQTWWSQPDYGHGFFVPVFALVLLWFRREMITGVPEQKKQENWWSEWMSYGTVFGAGVGAVVGISLFCILFTIRHADSTIPEVTVPEKDLAACRVRVGDPMPEAELPDLNGKSQPLGELYGKKLTVVCFWQTGESPGVRSEAIGPLEKLQMDYSELLLKRGVRIIGINEGGDPKTVQAGITNAGLKFPKGFANLSDADGALFTKVAAEGLPRVYLLDAEGKILWFDQEFSQTSRQNLKQAVQVALSLTWLHPATWFYLLLAGGYGGLLGGLCLQIAQLFSRRNLAEPLAMRGNMWGLAILALWASLRLSAAYFSVRTHDRLSLIICIIGVTLFIGGWPALRWAWQSLVFLFFMLPLPGVVAGAFRDFLQRLGTKISVYVIQTLGIPAVAQGNVINLTEGQLGVVEACSGLRMLMLFFAVCLGAAFVLRCPLWKKVVIVVCAVPIAVLSNVARITVTAFLHETVSPELADKVFHDMAGLLMMPLAMLLLWGVWVLLGKLFLEQMPERPLSLSGSLAGVSRDAGDRAATNRPK